MIPGKINTLTVAGRASAGFFLSDEDGEDAFIPDVFADKAWQTGDTVDVFVYQDNGWKATTEIPYAQVGEFAVLTCVQSLPSGAFMDWGIIKDLFVPYRQQKGKMVEGKRYLVEIFTDEKTGLVTGTTKFKRSQTYEHPDVQVGEKVNLIIAGQSELGWNVVINKKYLGLVYSSDVYRQLFPLSEEVGFIKTIREDGKIDVTLQPQGYENIDAYKEKIIAKLNENYGLLYLSDQSSPEEIKDELQMSKKNFKKALGSLYKDKIVDISEERIRLL